MLRLHYNVDSHLLSIFSLTKYFQHYFSQIVMCFVHLISCGPFFSFYNTILILGYTLLGYTLLVFFNKPNRLETTMILKRPNVGRFVWKTETKYIWGNVDLQNSEQTTTHIWNTFMYTVNWCVDIVCLTLTFCLLACLSHFFAHLLCCITSTYTRIDGLPVWLLPYRQLICIIMFPWKRN